MTIEEINDESVNLIITSWPTAAEAASNYIRYSFVVDDQQTEYISEHSEPVKRKPLANGRME